MVNLVAFLATVGVVVSASPARLPRESSSSCNGLGPGAFSTASGFSLNAVSSSGVRSPLVLIANSSTMGVVTDVLATVDSSPIHRSSTLSMKQGVIIIDEVQGYNGNGDVTPGKAVPFTATSPFPLNPPSIYCGVTYSTGGDPVLAVNGDPHSFGLCASSRPSGVVLIVVYKPDIGAQSCEPITLEMMGSFARS